MAAIVGFAMVAEEAWGQTIVGRSFITEVPDIRVYHMDVDEKQIEPSDSSPAFTFVGMGKKFTVVNLVSDGAVIKFWDFGKGDSSADVSDKVDYSGVGTYVDVAADGKHFLMKLTDLDSKCKEYFGNRHDFTWGAVTIPLKMRFGDGEKKYFGVEPTANLGLFAGWRRQIRGAKVQAINLLFGTSASNITLRDEDVDMVKYLEADSSAIRPDNALAISASIGTVYQIESFQIGIFLGWDIVPSQLGRHWRHRDTPWLGIGIGFGLFAKDKTGHGKGTN